MVILTCFHRLQVFQQELGDRYHQLDDKTNNAGKVLCDRAPKSEDLAIHEMLTELRDKWNALDNRLVDRLVHIVCRQLTGSFIIATIMLNVSQICNSAILEFYA